MSDLIRVGRVGRPHGLDGAFFVEEASEDPERFATGNALLAQGVRVEIVESKRSGGRPVIRLDHAIERGTPLDVERGSLPEPEEGSYYAFQLVGLEVAEEGGDRLGVVVEVSSGPANDVLELDSGLALPLVDACVQKVDLDAGRILVKPGFASHG
jgi:16S rRNA processing protein RimM